MFTFKIVHWYKFVSSEWRICLGQKVRQKSFVALAPASTHEASKSFWAYCIQATIQFHLCKRGWKPVFSYLTLPSIPSIFLHSFQCDQIRRFIGLRASFNSLWQQLIWPNCPHFRQFCKGVKICHFSSQLLETSGDFFLVTLVPIYLSFFLSFFPSSWSLKLSMKYRLKGLLLPNEMTLLLIQRKLCKVPPPSFNHSGWAHHCIKFLTLVCSLQTDFPLLLRKNIFEHIILLSVMENALEAYSLNPL